jgi:hypothetical protein
MDDEAKFTERLKGLAESHCRMGVKSSEYAYIGDVMFWTLKTCLGPAYDGKTHTAWVKIFSKMLKIIVPISISYELKNNTAQRQRVDQFNNSTSPSNRAGNGTCPFIPSAEVDNEATRGNTQAPVVIKDVIQH